MLPGGSVNSAAGVDPQAPSNNAPARVPMVAMLGSRIIVGIEWRSREPRDAEASGLASGGRLYIGTLRRSFET